MKTELEKYGVEWKISDNKIRSRIRRLLKKPEYEYIKVKQVKAIDYPGVLDVLKEGGWCPVIARYNTKAHDWNIFAEREKGL